MKNTSKPVQSYYSSRRLLYTSVLCQCFSPCGRYLAVGDSHGYIHVFSLVNALTSCASEENWEPIYKFQAQKSDSPIYALQSSGKFLISSGTGPISAWQWSDIVQKDVKVAWEINVDFKQRDSMEPFEINALAIKSEEHRSTLIAGAGDNNIYQYDMGNGSLMRTYSGHTDYVHCVDVTKDGSSCVVSGAQDGQVRIWDDRSDGTVHVLQPGKNEACCRADRGKVISCLDTSNDWILCGGGPSLALWQLKTLSPFTVFSTPRSSPYWTVFDEDTVLSVGSEATMFTWALNGDVLHETPVTPTHCFHVATNKMDQTSKIYTVCGNRYKVDVLINPGYRSFSLELR